MPRKRQAEVTAQFQQITNAATRREATLFRDGFARTRQRTLPKAINCLECDWVRMFANYDFPQEHWKHLRTTSIIESPFAAVRLRTTAAKRSRKSRTRRR